MESVDINKDSQEIDPIMAAELALAQENISRSK
jgi:hypothetical protein